MSLEEDVVVRLRPTAAERKRMDAVVSALCRDAQAALDAAGLAGEASVQGSIAKDTWLAGSTDIDMFLLLDPAVPEAQLPGAARAVAQAALADPRERYAQHPYVVGRREGMMVDVVPAYRVAHASHRMSAVDRTPFHTKWVASNLDAAGRDEVRLAKTWCKGVEVYGADTATAGFSGYLVEVLVAVLGSFSGFVDWLARGAQPRRLAAGQDAVVDDAPLVVPDPIDPARNCAAAVGQATLERAIDAARAYRESPSMRFFFPAPPAPAAGEALHDALAARGETWVGLWLPDAAERLDIVFPQFQKAATRIRAGLEGVGFAVIAQDAWTDERHVGLQWRLRAGPLPATRRHVGPAPGSPHAKRFHQKWQGHADAAAAVREEDGQLVVDIVVRQREADTWLKGNLEALPLGKHVQAASARAAVLADPADVVLPWSPVVADFILERRPWQR